MTESKYKRVPGGTSMISGMFRMGAGSARYAIFLTANFDRFHFGHRGDLIAEETETGVLITCRGIEIMSLTLDEIEAHRARSSYHFEDTLIRRLREEEIHEASKIKNFAERQLERQLEGQLEKQPETIPGTIPETIPQK
jgi:hypothetical protein